MGFVQFYLGTWMHMRGAYPSHMEGQRSHGAALGRCILVNGGQAEETCFGDAEFC